ncbi:MAG: histidine kinase dimerization/phospho-acceptor domain-containing protein, partial [Candidatus Latescibacteria bacterium]|nr:histidine kinase dimerization/phospho-acceptor domain-containing protein [Candidatus Latescibacterota bacterium]
MALTWYDIARLICSLIGAALLWGIYVSAVKRKGATLSLLVLIASGALAYSGEALSMLIESARPCSSSIACSDWVARLGLSFAPSALLATFISLGSDAGVPIAQRLHRYSLVLILVPALLVLYLGDPYSGQPRELLTFSVYLILCLILSARLSWTLTRRYETEVHRKFYRLMAIALIGIAVLVSIGHPLGADASTAFGPVLKFALFLSPLVPAFILGYFVYRFSFGRIVVNPALLYSAVTGIVLAVYLLAIRGLAREYSRIGGLRAEIVEVVLITLLVFLFQPVKNRLQRLISRLFFRARYAYQNLLGDLSRSLTTPIDLELRLTSVLEKLGAALKVPLVSLTRFEREEGRITGLQTTSSPGLPGFPIDRVPFGQGEGDRVAQVADWLEANRRPLDTGELHHHRFLAPLAEQGVRLCFPLFRDEQVTGFLCLGDKKRGEAFTTEERELLTTLCNQISLAVENARLLDQTLAVERQLYEAQRLSSLGLLSASIAHEVKNPLSSIKAIASVLQEELEDNTTAAEDLRVVRSEIDRLTGVVERLLRFARPEHGNGHRDVALKPVVDDIALILSHEAEQHGVGIRSEVRADLVVQA